MRTQPRLLHAADRVRGGRQNPALSLMMRVAVLVAGVLAIAIPAPAVTVTIPVLKDNTLFEDPIGWTGGGAGDGIYSGHTGTSGSGIRRALVQFNLSSIPQGATITSVQLNLILLKVNNGTNTHTMHRMLNSWGEGASVTYGGSGVNAEIGDVTWLFRFYPTQPWINQGSDYVTSPSASRSVGTTLGTYTWGSSAGLVADVQGWINNPASNFGWVVRGNETGNKTAKKFASREYFATGVPLGSYAPTVTIAYTPPPPPPACTADMAPRPNGDGQVNIDDLVLVITSWGQTGPPGSVPADITGDGTVNIDDLVGVITEWGACG